MYTVQIDRYKIYKYIVIKQYKLALIEQILNYKNLIDSLDKANILLLSFLDLIQSASKHKIFDYRQTL